MTIIPLAAVTGASEGLGKEFARQLAAKGYNLLVIARRPPLLDELKADLEAKYHVQVEPFVCDLSNPDELKRLEDRLEKEASLEVMVNNAGFGLGDAFPEVDPDTEERMIRLHTIALMRLSRAALVPMCKRKKGYVINVSSVAAFLYCQNTADYCATKAYVLSFSKSLQCDVRRYGVRVQALCPGFTHTGFHSTESMNFFQKSAIPSWAWLSSEYVVRTSLNSIRRTRWVVCVPSLRYKLALALFCNPIGSAMLGLFTRPGKEKRQEQ
jgi:short-subunit dehydrogenase